MAPETDGKTDTTLNGMVQALPIADIQVGRRYRKDLGNIKGLVESIREVGLLHPVVVDEDDRLIAGQRRLEACKVLGWTDIPVHIVSLKEIALGEYHENRYRMPLRPSEKVAIARVLHLDERKAAKQRQAQAGPKTGRGRKKTASEKSPKPVKGRAIDNAAAAVSMSRPTLVKATEVVDAAEKDPSLAPIAEEMDRTGNVDKAHRRMKEAQTGTQAKVQNRIYLQKEKRISLEEFTKHFPEAVSDVEDISGHVVALIVER